MRYHVTINTEVEAESEEDAEKIAKLIVSDLVQDYDAWHLSADYDDIEEA